MVVGLMLLVGAAWAFGVLAEDVATGDPIVRLDQWVADGLHDRRSGQVTAIMSVITTLGTAWALVPIAVAAAAYLLWRGSRREAILVALAIVGAELLTLGFKTGFERRRPFFPDPLATESSFSFPSGHATVSVALYGALAYIAATRLHRPANRRAVLGATSAFVLLIGFSRLYLGVHFLSDVLAGFSGGLAWLVLCVLALGIRR
ncbi:MAG: phosphatase PAP2 family protein [Thermoleophilaceae bacterium]|nr:phosphatase PAP2 family protein [Thermoleophilaceae bacterium]